MKIASDAAPASAVSVTCKLHAYRHVATSFSRRLMLRIVAVMPNVMPIVNHDEVLSVWKHSAMTPIINGSRLEAMEMSVPQDGSVKLSE